jgi:hypothetical protein
MNFSSLEPTYPVTTSLQRQPFSENARFFNAARSVLLIPA